MADTMKRSRWKAWHRVTLVVLLGFVAYVAWGRPSTPQQERSATTEVADHDVPVSDLADGGAAVGFWCDTPLNSASNSDNVIAIVTLADDGMVVRSLFRGGANLEQRLLPEADGVYAVDDSHHGDRFRVAAGGSLILMDADGVIRTARSLRADADASHCFR